MSEQKTLLPDDIADMFIEKYKIHMRGEKAGPTFDDQTLTTIMTHIRANPMAMIEFLSQSCWAIKLKADEEFNDKEETINALGQFNQVMMNMLVIPLSGLMVANLEMYAKLNGKVTEHLPIIEGLDPQEVFKNVEGFDFKEWLTGDDLTS